MARAQSPIGKRAILTFSIDEIEAEVAVTPDGAAEGIEYAELEELLARWGVVFGISHDTLRRIADSPADFVGQRVRVAEGVAPVPGEDGKLDFHIMPPKSQAAIERSDGTIEYVTMAEVIEVEKDTRVADILPPVPGQDGRTVKGRPAPAPPVKPARPKLGSNLVIRGDALLSTADGHITIDATGKISVLKVLEIVGDVDARVGHIEHVGNLVVKGSVRSGLNVKVRGDILVEGSVEACVLDAGGNITVNGVVTTKAVLRAGGSVSARALEGCSVQAGGNVDAEHDILHAEVVSAKIVNCTKGRGIILGGTVQAALRIQANVIGNEVNVATNLEIGVRPYRAKEIHDLEFERNKHAAEIERLDKLISFLEKQAAQGPLAPHKAQSYKQAQVSKMEQQRLMEQSVRKREAILAEVHKWGNTVDAARRLHRGVSVTIGQKQIRIMRDYGPCKVKPDPTGEIAVRTG